MPVLHVKLLTGALRTLVVDAEDTLEAVKLAVRQPHARLGYAGKELPDESTVREAGVPDGATVYCLGRVDFPDVYFVKPDGVKVKQSNSDILLQPIGVLKARVLEPQCRVPWFRIKLSIDGKELCNTETLWDHHVTSDKRVDITYCHDFKPDDQYTLRRWESEVGGGDVFFG